MGRCRRLTRMRQMDPQRDFEQIYRWITQYEFPRDYLHGTSVAFLRDYGVPRISRLLDRTQEFERAGQKRYDDTVLIAYEMVRDGLDSEQGRAAARHLNRIHGRYRIPNEDFLYVLATTVVGPKRWIDRFGWRPLCAQETESLALVGRRMGEMMGISEVPGTYAEFERLHDAYEREMFAYDPANRRVAAATLRVMAAWYPAPLRRIAVRASLAVLDEPLLTALGFQPQPAWLRAVVHRALRLRGRVHPAAARPARAVPTRAEAPHLSLRLDPGRPGPALGPVPPGAATAGREAAGRRAAGRGPVGPSAAGRRALGRAVTGRRTAGPRAARRRAAGRGPVGPSAAERRAAGRQAFGRRTAGRRTARRGPAAPPAAEHRTARREAFGRRTAGPGAAERRALGRAAAGRRTARRGSAGPPAAGRRAAGREAFERRTAGPGAAERRALG
ncbi:hypothetical protein RKD35_006228 [Streptomyces albogriseolus]